MTLDDLRKRLPPPLDPGQEAVRRRMQALGYKLIVLDDDPTGVQTVHDVSVYTDWSEESISRGFAEPNSMFFLLTNSRGVSREETIRIHRTIGRRVAEIAAREHRKFLLISRGDSTLRGYYPLETQVLKEELEAAGSGPFDGEILCPVFPEGGRYTAGNIHYVLSDGVLIPAGETEFARDATFGYSSSDLTEWVEEKTRGSFPAREQIAVSLEELRSGDTQAITRKLAEARNFQKVIVNAVDYGDLRVFALALADALDSGEKHFLFRTAAALPKVLSGMADRPLLSRAELEDPDNSNGGLFIIGSHVQKTTRQLEKLLTIPEIVPIEFHSSLILSPPQMAAEWERVHAEMSALLRQGKSAAVYTERKVLLPQSQDAQAALKISLRISDAVTRLISELEVRPRFIVAKGGITSSEIGVRGLSVRRATVLGQILPGVPVWKTDAASKFQGLPYIIFPGNVGADDSLWQIGQLLL